MRAGLILGGAFLMFFGTILFITILFLPLGVLFGFIGFIMLIAGLVTPSCERIIIQQPAPTPPSPQEPKPISDSIKFCIRCGNQNTKDAFFCRNCGNKFPQP